ncbi:uncharacterized protein [Paralichthys olivaceus]|uniref:uncharacterized protein isoform X2 n=1 Tax=Paralichthys olivaceus TaxID=8255 RepID=UPI0037538556
MDPSWPLVVLSAAVSVSVVVVTLVCVNCWRRRPLVSIRQTHASEDYMPSTEFRVIHPLQPPIDLNSIRSAPFLLSPPRVLSSSDGTQRSHRSFTATDTESNPSYENPTEGAEYVNPDAHLPDSDVEDPGYIIVIPDREPSINQSRASTPSSDVRNDYVNLGDEEQEKQEEQAEEEHEEQEEEEEEQEEQDYMNVHSKKTSAHSDTDTDDETDDDDYDDYEGNYVNQPPVSLIPDVFLPEEAAAHFVFFLPDDSVSSERDGTQTDGLKLTTVTFLNHHVASMMFRPLTTEPVETYLGRNVPPQFLFEVCFSSLFHFSFSLLL